MTGGFWNTQPVNRGWSNGAIEHAVETTTIPTGLPEGFEWIRMNDSNAICNFLENFYVEDTTSMYRLSYSREFFKFLFAHPRHREEYSLGLTHNQRLIGYILAREHRLETSDNEFPAVSINFLCIDKEFRMQNFAPLLIKEITRIVNSNGIFQAVFTAEKDYGFAIARARYYHYPMNAKNLIQACMIDDIDEAKAIPDLRSGTVLLQNPAEIYDLYHRSVCNFVLHEKIEPEIFNQVFARNENLVTVVNKETGEFASFFVIDTKCTKYGIVLKRAYLYYWSGTSEIVRDAIAYSHTIGIDMFDILNIARNGQAIHDLKLAEGSGVLYYHLFNLNEKILPSSEINFILF